MDPAVAEHVSDLHRRALIVDAHFDLPYEVINRRERGARRVVATDYMDDFKTGGVDLIVASIFIHNYFIPEMALRRALDQISGLHEELAETPELFVISRTTEEIRNNQANGRLSLLLALEGADPLHNDLRLLRIFYELGVRWLGLTWSRRNYAADGCHFNKVAEGRRGGLTAFGVELVKQAQKLGMVIDVSHINEEGFWDVIDITATPVVASHSNCRALADTPRNLSDEQIKALAAKGGVMGMNALDVFIRTGGGPKVTVKHLVDHVDHIVKLVGSDHVGVGLDLCDSFKDVLSLKRAIDARDVIANHAALLDFTAVLVERGFSDEDILKILGGNFLRVLSETLV
jgi:membrane dipeptidase